MKAVHISVVAMIAALSGIGLAIATKNSEALVTSILALVTAFLPAAQLVLPWFTPAPVQGEMPKFEGDSKALNRTVFDPIRYSANGTG